MTCCVAAEELRTVQEEDQTSLRLSYVSSGYAHDAMTYSMNSGVHLTKRRRGADVCSGGCVCGWCCIVLFDITLAGWVIAFEAIATLQSCSHGSSMEH
jgi:hypothetical protein